MLRYFYLTNGIFLIDLMLSETVDSEQVLMNKRYPLMKNYIYFYLCLNLIIAIDFFIIFPVLLWDP